jgi:HK97 family phage portal protein
MILTKALEEKYQQKPEKIEHLGGFGYASTRTKSGQTVTADSARGVAAFYRAGTMICADVAAMPFQTFRRTSDGIQRLRPDARTQNLAYLIEIQPNHYDWTPFQYRFAAMQWLLYWGNSYEWSPPIRPAQKFILRADRTRPVLDAKGQKWYETYFDSAKPYYIPAVEIMHTLINPDAGGHVGRGVVAFARETVGRRMAANDAANELYQNGMNAKAYIQMNATLDKAGREKVRDAYTEALSDGLAVFDQKVLQFEPVSLSLADSQFVEQNAQTDVDIANFFGVSAHFLNAGKQSYQSNYQKYEEYNTGTLNQYLVQIEQAARIKWLSQAEQSSTYFKFNRASLLRMNPKERAETNEVLLRSGQLTPNEARAMEERNAYPDGDAFWMTKNYEMINRIGEEDDPSE